MPCQLTETLPAASDCSLGETLYLVDFSESASYLEQLAPIAQTAILALINLEHLDQDLDDLVHRFDLRGIFLKNTEPEQLIQGIKSIFAGECWLPRKLTATLFNLLKSDAHVRPESADNEEIARSLLTAKEMLILKAMVDGLTNQDIATKIYLSQHTIKTHIYHIYKKLGVKNRAQAINWANRHFKKES